MIKKKGVLVKRKKLISLLLGAAIFIGVFSGTAQLTQAKTGQFSDTFGDYAYESVDSSRYTLYGEGKFESDNGRMKISYNSAASTNGLFVNISDILNPDDTIKLSFDYSNNNANTARSAKVFFYCDEAIAGEAVYETEGFKGNNVTNGWYPVNDIRLTVPEYQDSAYLYISSEVERIWLDNLNIEKYDASAYEPEGSAVEVLTEEQYGNIAMQKPVLFEDACKDYTPETVPGRYSSNLDTAVFQSNSGALQLYEKDKPSGHGLRVNIKDIVENKGLKAGDSFYLSYFYGCDNGSTASSSIVHLMIDGAEASSQVIADDIYGEGKNRKLYAKVVLPTNLPDQIDEMYLLLEGSNVDKMRYKDIKITQEQPYTPTGAVIEKLTIEEYENASRQNLFVDSGSYSSVESIPDRYWVNKEDPVNSGFHSDSINGFIKNGSAIQIKYQQSGSNHGLCMDISDLIRSGGLKQGDDFYLTYKYSCWNVNTASTTIAHLIVDGVDAGSVLLAEDIRVNGAGKDATVYAKITLPDNLPENFANMHLYLEGTAVDSFCFANIAVAAPNKLPENALVVSEPLLNKEGTNASITVTNTKDTNVSLTVKVQTGEENPVENTIVVEAGAKESPHIFNAADGAKVTIEADSITYYTNFELHYYQWVGTWGTAIQEYRDSEKPETSLSGSTIRQVVRISTGGEKLRLKLSNQYDTSPLNIESIHIAPTTDEGGSGANGSDKVNGRPEIDTTKDTKVTFTGNDFISIGPGETAVSDTIAYEADDLSRITVTMKVASAPAKISGHTGSRTTSYIKSGAAVDAQNLGSDAETKDNWFYIAGLDVQKEDGYGAVVCLGDSITDGRGVTINADNRWSDVLAQRLKGSGDTETLSVLNMGIGGNTVYGGGLGPNALDRFDRDVMGQSGVKYVIILEGINNINSSSVNASNRDEVVNKLISAYQEFITKAHAQGIKVYGGTITPFEGTSTYNEDTKYIRNSVNSWIRDNAGNTGENGQVYFDEYIDFASVVQVEGNEEKLKESYQNDNLHPTAALYKVMGDFIDLNLFRVNEQ